MWPSLFSVQQENFLTFGSRTERRKSLSCWLSHTPLIKGKAWLFYTGRLWGEYSACSATCFARDSSPEIWSQLYGFCHVSWRPRKGRYVCVNSAGDNRNPQELEIPQDSKILRYCIFVEKSICFGDYGLQPELFLTLKMELILTPAGCNFFHLALCEGIT